MRLHLSYLTSKAAAEKWRKDGGWRGESRTGIRKDGARREVKARDHWGGETDGIKHKKGSSPNKAA